MSADGATKILTRKMYPIDEKFKILQPILGTQKVKKLKQMYFFEDDYRQKKEIENYIDVLIIQNVKKDIEDQIILPPPPKESCDGEVHIGEVEYVDKPLYPFNLEFKDINRHMGIFGSTGSGKTTFATNLLRKLHKTGIPFLIFDWEKSYRGIIREFSDVQVFTVGSEINPLFLNFLTVPPGIKFDEYIKSIIAIISEDYIGGIGADTMLLNYMEMAFQETGHPYFEDLKQIVLREINHDKGRGGRLAGRSGLWKESVSRQITFMSKGAAGTVINPRKHFPLEKLFSKPIVLEFGNLKSPYDRKFFIHIILNWLSIYNQHRGIHSEQLKQVLMFEEFHNIAMQGKEDNMVSTLFRESRKYGIGLIAIDQTPSEIPNAIFANMNIKVSFTLNTNRDIAAMAKAMNLDAFQQKYLGMIKTGQAIVNVKQRYHGAFQIKTPFIKSPEYISDDELKAAMLKFAEISQPDSSPIENLSIPQTSQGTDTFPPITPMEKVILTNITERPLDGVDQRTKTLGFHPSQMSQIHESLTKKEMIRPVYIDRKKLFELTDSGKILVEEMKIHMPSRNARGGLEHDYWVHQTVQFLKKHEFQPVCEVNGIDIVDPKLSIAIEVETGKSDIKKNLLKLEKSRILNCFMIATNKPAEIKIKELSKNHSFIRILFVKDFLKLTEEKILTSHPSPTSIN